MKLLTRTNLNFLTISLLIFLIGMMVFYYLLRGQVDANINNELSKKESAILAQLNRAHGSAQPVEDPNEKITIEPLASDTTLFHTFSDTVLLDQRNGQYGAFRRLSFSTVINGQPYRVTLYKSLGETDNLIIRILLLLTLVVVALIAALLLLNQHTSRKAWHVFYDTLDKINHYDLSAHSEFTLQPSDIEEFAELNRQLLAMTERIRDDYRNLKEYTENASHELQTPLAIITSKLEVLLQSENLSEKELQTITDAIEATSKLSRMNQTLLLLAKIENRQFPVVSDVDLAELVESHVGNFEEIIETKAIKVTLPENPGTVKMNRYLAEVMVANLIKNAIRHNVRGGELRIELDEKTLAVANSGARFEGSEEQLFKRFYKGSNSAKSTGLGLPIVQKICEVSGFSIRYDYRDDLHRFTVLFEKQFK